MNIKETAKHLGISVASVRRKIKSGEIKADMVKGPFGPEYVIDEAVLNPYAEVTDIVKMERSVTLEQLQEVMHGLIIAREGDMLKGIGDKIDILADENRLLREQIVELREILIKVNENKVGFWARLFSKKGKNENKGENDGD